MSMLSILGVVGTKSTMRKIVPFPGGTSPTLVLPRSAVEEKSGGLASVTHISLAGLGERKLVSWTLPSNIATALPEESSLVTTRRTSGGFCCCAAADPISATAALTAARDKAIFTVLLLYLELVSKRPRHPRESGDPVTFTQLDSRFRGNDEICLRSFCNRFLDSRCLKTRSKDARSSWHSSAAAAAPSRARDTALRSRRRGGASAAFSGRR